MPYPSTFIEKDYIKWHEKGYPEDCPFDKKLEGVLSHIKDGLANKFGTIDFVLRQIFHHSYVELKRELGTVVKHSFDFPHQDLKEENWVRANVLKSKSSIINKLWRKNPDSNISFSNITTEINDLIRFSVKASSFYHCEFVCDRLRDWEDIIKEEDKKECETIKKIEIDKEAKLSSGYYAIHTAFKWSNSL